VFAGWRCRVTAALEATLLCAGICRMLERFVRPDGRLRRIDMPALAVLFRHPREGIGLFDTGYAPRVHEATEHLPFRLYRLAAEVVCAPEAGVAAQLAVRGIVPEDVRWIVLSHFDPDHVGGLVDFPAARVICLRTAWEWVHGKRGWAALRARVFPGLIPDDLESRLQLLEAPTGPELGPLGPTHDLFGDGTLNIVQLPGHAPGQLGALAQVGNGREWLLAADACWTRAALSHGGSLGHGVVAVDRAAQRLTTERLVAFCAAHPDVVLIPAHCPEAAFELLPQPERERFMSA
jgi:glyoxylase-like metal-dependent hydrolase (beta-lactamase superfamily II)